MKRLPVIKFKIGDGATILRYSDQHAFTVIAVTPKTITLQRDKTELLNDVNSGEPDALATTSSGFCGHTEGIQRYSYKTDSDGYTAKATLRKDGIWRQVGSPQDEVIFGRYEYYDYNF